jgi:hypothetical protein
MSRTGALLCMVGILILTLVGLYVQHAVLSRIWVPARIRSKDRGNPRKILIELVGRRAFRMHDYHPYYV